MVFILTNLKQSQTFICLKNSSREELVIVLSLLKWRRLKVQYQEEDISLFISLLRKYFPGYIWKGASEIINFPTGSSSMRGASTSTIFGTRKLIKSLDEKR